MYHDFLGPRGLQGTHMNTLNPKNLKSITFTVREGFFTLLAILAHSAAAKAWSLPRFRVSIAFGTFELFLAGLGKI
jgi:hypothetical protein